MTAVYFDCVEELLEHENHVTLPTKIIHTFPPSLKQKKDMSVIKPTFWIRKQENEKGTKQRHMSARSNK